MSDIMDSAVCLGLACGSDLPVVTTRHKDVVRSRRPMPHEVEVYSFPQVWGSTALGFGGIGGAAMTTAQTTVVIKDNDAAVYFGRRLAYVIDGFNEILMGDIRRLNMAECSTSSRYKRTNK